MTLVIISLIYLTASAFNLFIPDTGVNHKPLRRNPAYLIHEFGHCFMLLWRDKLGQISLAVTTLFWGAGATLQFIVIEWAHASLGLDLSHASMMQGIFAIGVAGGAILAARLGQHAPVCPGHPLGIAMGLVVIVMAVVHTLYLAVPLLLVLGALAGLFVVPMNALLQHRGHVLMGAGHSIAVQNFNENLSILVMTAAYSALLGMQLGIKAVIVLFGLFVAGAMYAVKLRHEANQRERDDLSLLDDTVH